MSKAARCVPVCLSSGWCVCIPSPLCLFFHDVYAHCSISISTVCLPYGMSVLYMNHRLAPLQDIHKAVIQLEAEAQPIGVAN